MSVCDSKKGSAVRRFASWTGTLGLGAWALLAAVGCGGGQSTFDVTVKVDSALFNSPGGASDASMVTACRVIVSGADHDDFYLSENSMYPCNNGLRQAMLGTFGYKSSATSGTVTFEVQLIGNNPLDPPLGSGTGSGAAHEGSRTAVDITVTKK